MSILATSSSSTRHFDMGLAEALGSMEAAVILQQLHYWMGNKGVGVIVEQKKYIYNTFQDWVSQQFRWLSVWQFRKAMNLLRSLGIVEVIRYKATQWNQTNHYTLNYKRLREWAKAESIGMVEMWGTTDRGEGSQTLEVRDSNISNTKNTFKENYKDLNPPNHPCEREKEQDSKQEQESYSSNPSEEKKEQNFSSSSKVIPKGKEKAERSINEVESKTEKPKPPWKDNAEFREFYRALIQALPIVANSHSPQGLAQVIIRQLKSGVPHSYWDDFAAGLPIGTSTKPEWEIEPGVAYPMFVEYLTEKLKAGNNQKTNEQARNEAFRILSQPRQAIAFWGQFKRSVVNVAEQVERDRALGVRNPNTPVWTRERIEPTISEAVEAGEKIMAVNIGGQTALEVAQDPKLKSSTPEQTTPAIPPDPWKELEPKPSLREMLSERGVRGFVRAMPKVSKSEAEEEAKALALEETKRKTHINQMSVEEINEVIKDPVMKAELMPQLLVSDYELITDYLGQIIRVELSELQKREARRIAKENQRE